VPGRQALLRLGYKALFLNFEKVSFARALDLATEFAAGIALFQLVLDLGSYDSVIKRDGLVLKISDP
jgi:hypothetical protein